MVRRNDGRANDEMRPWTITCGILDHAEGTPFSVARLNALIRLAQKGIRELEKIQGHAVQSTGREIP